MRVFFSDNGSLIDLTANLTRYDATVSSLGIVAAEDAVYIGQRLPFNHLYFKMGTANTANVTTTAAYWDGDAWIPVVELRDETAGLSASGFMTWVPDRDKSWTRESTNYDSDSITGLTGVVVYDLYWLKLTFSGNFTGSPTIQWVGNLFADDTDLGAEFPDLVRTNVLTSFKAAKTDWQEQHVRAAEVMAQDIVNAGVVLGKQQILVREDYRPAAIQKVAEIIMRSFGTDYVEPANAARNEYKHRLAMARATVDRNNNATEDVAERFSKTGFMTR